MHAYDCYQPHISSAGSAAGDTSCIPPAPTTNLAVIGNVTKDLSTCKKWGLRALGGTPPYNITLAAVGSPVVTNVTLPSGDDVLTWVDRALPNTQILGESQMSLLKVFDLKNICIAAVTDATGQWGNTTTLVNTVGSSDYSCTGLVSRVGNSSQIPFYYYPPPDKKRTIGIAVGVTLGGIVVIAAAVFLVLRIRRQSRRARGIEDGQDTLPRVFGPGNDSAMDPFVVPTTQSNNSTLGNKRMMSQLMIGTHGSASSGPSSDPATSPPPGITSYSDSRPDSGHSSTSIDRPLPAIPHRSPRPESRDSASTSNPYPHSPRHHTKAAEAQARPAGAAEEGHSSQAERRSAASNQRPFSGDADIIIQHRDGGIVRELPPPYLDRSASATSNTTQ